MGKEITVIWYGNTPRTYKNVEDFIRLDDHTVKFKNVEKDGKKVITTYITTNFPYHFEEVIEHSGMFSV